MKRGDIVRCIREPNSMYFECDRGQVLQLYEIDEVCETNGNIKIVGLAEDDIFHKIGVRGWLNHERFEKVGK